MSEAPASSCVPAAPTRLTVNDIRLIAPSVDGNTVELAVEQMEFAENSIRYQTTLDFINSKIKGLMGAIRGE